MSLSTELKDDELSIGKLIKKQRKEKGLTQQALAEELNVSSQAISKWEREICEPDKQLGLNFQKFLIFPRSDLHVYMRLLLIMVM